MIQDIAPHTYHSEYKPSAPDKNSFILAYEKGSILLPHQEREADIYFPRFQDLEEKVSDLYSKYIYLFSIDDQRFYLIPELDTTLLPDYEFQDIRNLRTARPQHLAVLEAAASVAVDFTEVVLADSEVTELMASAVALVQAEVISAVRALVVLTAVKVRIFMLKLLSALMKLPLAVRRLSVCRAATAVSRTMKSIFRQVLNPVNLSDLKEKDIRESAEVKPVTCF